MNAGSQQTVLEQLADKICGFDLQAIPPEAYRLARTAIMTRWG